MEESRKAAQQPLVKARELERFGVSKHSAYVLARSGLLPHYKVGKKRNGIRFIVSEVLAALRSVPNEAEPK